MKIEYENIISVENLLLAWEEFLKGKRNRGDVQEFSFRLADNILSLRQDLKTLTYNHGSYQSFSISDPKPRIIHKAPVRDKLLHHAIHRILYPFFEKRFVNDSYSCRIGKGTHKAADRFQKFFWKVSKNNTKTCWVLKCDIKKFFASIDQEILMKIFKKHISNEDIVWLINRIVGSFSSTKPGKGLPLGNLTSQLLVNIYMNEFDQFVKHKLKQKYYIRYADDFVFLSENKSQFEEMIPQIEKFLSDKLKLQLHPNKVYIKTFASGVDFLGWVHFPDHRVLRTATKRKMLRKLKEDEVKPETVASYLGMLKHGNTNKLKAEVVANLGYNGKYDKISFI